MVINIVRKRKTQNNDNWRNKHWKHAESLSIYFSHQMLFVWLIFFFFFFFGGVKWCLICCCVCVFLCFDFVFLFLFLNPCISKKTWLLTKKNYLFMYINKYFLLFCLLNDNVICVLLCFCCSLLLFAMSSVHKC